MNEQSPRPQPKARFGEGQPSRFLEFGAELHLPGDPETATDFDRARHYLATITAHCIEFGPWWEKKPEDLVYELDYHNAWHQYEVEQERKAGEKQAKYHAINIHQLQALSKRRMLAFEESGLAMTPAYRVVRFFDQLIEAAVVAQEESEKQMAGAQPRRGELFSSSTDASDKTPF